VQDDHDVDGPDPPAKRPGPPDHLAPRSRSHSWTAGSVTHSFSIERGRSDPSLPLAFRIAQVFGARIDEIFSPAEDASASAPLG
jgi:hypothetical protein